MSDIWLLRHARPLVEPGTCYGATDMPADSLETAASAQAFWQAWDLDRQALPDHLLCSPLQRCVQLAEALTKLRSQVDIQIEPDLREMDFGCWEGNRWAEIPKQAVDVWTEHFADHAFGGKESVQDLITRVGRVCREQLARSPSATPGTRIWVTHDGVIKAAHWWCQSGGQKIERADQWPRMVCAFGSWRKLSAQLSP